MLVGDTEDRILRLARDSIWRRLSLRSLTSNARSCIHHFVRVLCFEINALVRWQSNY
jgi:hypothetical protein